MLVYRLARQKYALHLDGQGAAIFGGRWNSVGQRVIYTSENRSLAVLEYRANNPLPVNDLMILSLELPDDSIQSIGLNNMPDDWQTYTFESPCTPLGDQWLRQQNTLVLKVPSAVVPQEHNVLINPLHPHMEKVRIIEALPFLIDQRMYTAGPGSQD